ncbi:MAG: hypothetical protein K2Y39_16820 [Candidatus Obscuribacterales bacterium]|nr:hypothetical protein [Candidatus Obscuribacterales bacterium]
MIWIESVLAEIAEVLSLDIAMAKWEIVGTANDATSYQLIILGYDSKRAVKLFTAAELDRCLADPELQIDLKARLTPLVVFTGSKVRVKVSKKSAVKPKRRKG